VAKRVKNNQMPRKLRTGVIMRMLKTGLWDLRKRLTIYLQRTLKNLDDQESQSILISIFIGIL